MATGAAAGTETGTTIPTEFQGAWTTSDIYIFPGQTKEELADDRRAFLQQVWNGSFALSADGIDWTLGNWAPEFVTKLTVSTTTRPAAQQFDTESLVALKGSPLAMTGQVKVTEITAVQCFRSNDAERKRPYRDCLGVTILTFPGSDLRYAYMTKSGGANGPLPLVPLLFKITPSHNSQPR